MKLICRSAPWVGAALLLACSALVRAAPAQASPAFPAHYSVPYLQVETADVGDVAADMNASGDKFYSLAFLTPTPGSGCLPLWEDNNDPMAAFTSQVKSLQSAGGNVIISFGGASGGELAISCRSTSKLEAAYAKVVSTYGVNRLDFDIEGNDLNNTTANARRDTALAELETADPRLTIDYTLPVHATGLTSNALALLKDAKHKGVKVNLVNVMTMDFGNGQNVLADAESAARATAGQLAHLYGITTAAAYDLLGLTPIAGHNNDEEDFTEADARKLESFAANHGVQDLSFWEVDRYDKPVGYAYSKTFQKITS